MHKKEKRKEKGGPESNNMNTGITSEVTDAPRQAVFGVNGEKNQSATAPIGTRTEANRNPNGRIPKSTSISKSKKLMHPGASKRTPKTWAENN